jgi:ribosomal-protein-alanine N-acetyltransferase
MLPTYHTARLIVRPLAAGDLEPLFHMIYADPSVARTFTSYTTYEEVADLHRRKVEANADPASAGFGSWGAVLRETATLVGQVLLGPPEPMPWIVLPETSPAYPLGDEVELGYAFGRAYWGKGYAVEACRVIVRHAFEQVSLGRLVYSTGRMNSRSVRLMERLGFSIEPNLLPGSDDVVGVLTAEAFRRRGWPDQA